MYELVNLIVPLWRCRHVETVKCSLLRLLVFLATFGASAITEKNLSQGTGSTAAGDGDSSSWNQFFLLYRTGVRNLKTRSQMEGKYCRTGTMSGQVRSRHAARHETVNGGRPRGASCHMLLHQGELIWQHCKSVVCRAWIINDVRATGCGSRESVNYCRNSTHQALFPISTEHQVWEMRPSYFGNILHPTN
jgi:hypothetical protein